MRYSAANTSPSKGHDRSSDGKNPFTISLLIIFLLVFSLYHNLQAQTGVYTLNGGTASQANQTYDATLTDQSAVYVLNSGQLTLTNCIMIKTGDASNVNNSSQYGINAGILATSAGQVTIIGGSVTTNASGANGVFAQGTGSSVSMSDGFIDATGSGAHGVDATYGGAIILSNVNITTNGSNSSALATDFGGGNVTVTGGTIISESTEAGSHSAGIYSTGIITVTGATVSSYGDCGGVIDGANSIILTNTSLTGALQGIKIWKTAPMSGPATVTITGGSLTATSGDGFYITGETGNTATANITMSNGATISAGTGNIMNVLSSSAGIFTADGETLSGNFTADATSTLSMILQNNTNLTGNAQNAGIAIDGTSSWTLTGNSVMTTVIDPSGISGFTVTNIIGNGYNIHYDSSLTGNQYLGGLTYSLVNGGVLTPESAAGVKYLQAGKSPVSLDQNYPNPVSSTTMFNFNLLQKAFVSLKVYDQKGKEVSVLVGSDQETGKHEILWDASALANGIYFYRLISEGFVQTRKMIIQK
ncbi:MAG: T9SS type A sorting domain-containing protein [Bacteroidales bacterium]|nr:T9SS type A sorting domain-containing protein [Bacteroidales bacterium]